MAENKKLRVAITHGDTNGIGYELIFKTFAAPEILELCTPVIYGSAKAAAVHRKVSDMDVNLNVISSAAEAKDGRVNLLTVMDEEINVEIGRAAEDAGRAALAAIDKAVVDYQDHLFDVLVTAPVCVESIRCAGVRFTGQPDYIAECLGEAAQAMPILVNDRIRIGLTGVDTGEKSLADSMTKERLTERIATLARSLKRDFRISNPRIAVLAFNAAPTVEEKELVKTVTEELADSKVNAFGPYAAGSFVNDNMYDHFDGVLAVNYDQMTASGLALTADSSVEMVAGLPMVCVSTLQDASHDTAGRNMADESAFRQAVYLAVDVFRNREIYDAPYENPLPKLYHEKREESEKIRFSIPKKHEKNNKEQ